MIGNSTVYMYISKTKTSDRNSSRRRASSRSWPMSLGEYENVDHRLSRRFRLDPHPALPALSMRSVPLPSISISRLLTVAPLPLFSFFCSSRAALPSPRYCCERERLRVGERAREPSRGQTSSSSSFYPNLRPLTSTSFPLSLSLSPVPFAPRSSSQTLLSTLGWAAAVLYHCLSYLTLF